MEVKVSKNNTRPYISAENILELHDRVDTTNGIIYIEDLELSLLTSLDSYFLGVSPMCVMCPLANSLRNQHADAGSLAVGLIGSRLDELVGCFRWMVRRFGVRVLPRFLNRNDIGFENPGVPEEVCHDDILRAVEVVLDDFEGCLIHWKHCGWSEKLMSTSKSSLSQLSWMMSKIFRFPVVANLVGLAVGLLLPLMMEALASDSICFLFIRFSLPGAVGLLVFLATDLLLSFSTRTDDDDGGFHDTSESPSGAVVFRLFPMIAGIDGAWDDAWDEAAARLLVYTGSDRGARMLVGHSASLVCWLSGVLVIEASDGWLAMLLDVMLVALPPVATLAALLAVFLAAGLLFTELVLWVETGLPRDVTVFAVPRPLPMDAASLGVGSELTGPLLRPGPRTRPEPEPELDPAILGAGSEIDRYAGIR
ncbi:hypothetical protein N7522_006235 [Penicillium canescens]|nr:hypothetical protein N7522_006235 [Penicillium canescens]